MTHTEESLMAMANDAAPLSDTAKQHRIMALIAELRFSEFEAGRTNNSTKYRSRADDAFTALEAEVRKG